MQGLPLTGRILEKFPRVHAEVIEEPKRLKQPANMTWAKKGLLLARRKADPLKEFQVMSASAGRPYYSLDLISNCHLECTYCILQSYLENNPVITIFVNIEEILERLAEQIKRVPAGSVIGTGRIADSLALEGISEQNRYLIPFFARLAQRARQASSLLELKTKSDQVENILRLDHGGRTVVSWSLNPEAIIDREEYKTASLEGRLAAASKAALAGYPVGFHFDPVILHEGWRESYARTIDSAFRAISSERIAWASVGTLRYPALQGRIMRGRFPKNSAIHEGLVSTDRRLLHYPDSLREEMQSFLEAKILAHLPKGKAYRCMDFD